MKKISIEMGKENSITGGMKKMEVSLKGNSVTIGIAIIIIIAIAVLWWIYGGHYIWVPLETTLEAGV